LNNLGLSIRNNNLEMMKEGTSASSSGIGRLHRICLVVAVLSARTTRTRALQSGPLSGWLGSASTATTSSTFLAMTTMRRSAKSAASERIDAAGARSEGQKRSSPDTTDSNILEDGHGHINPDLAANLWNWEQQHRESANMPKLSFSTRQGLRLVDEIVTEIATSPRGQKLIKGSDDIKTDLVQEGVVALMDALNEFRQSAQAARTDDSDPNRSFEDYARPMLENHLWSTLDRTSRPVQLPKAESTVWRHIQLIRPKLQSELGGRAPTVEELAARLEMPPETLELLFSARRNSLSVESTVEIQTPDSLDDQPPHFADQDQWDAQEGHLLDTGDGISKQEVLVEEYQDEMYQYEGEDEMWIHQTQVAAPLRELIPDGGPSPDDLALSDMIRHDVGEFLTKTLTPEEVQVVRLCFGLDGGKQVVWEEIAYSLDDTATDVEELMTPNEVKKLLKGALEKLRTTYRNNYVEIYLEDNDFGEDSV